MVRSFVIHEHSGLGPTHYDLMFEDGPVLATWQITVSPSDIGRTREIPATKLPDHRKAYLDYQGPVSKGRGEVKTVEKGTYEIIERREDLWLVELHGQTLQGTFELTLCQPSIDGSGWHGDVVCRHAMPAKPGHGDKQRRHATHLGTWLIRRL